MGFFRRKPRPTWPPPGPITTWPSGPLDLTTNVSAVMFEPPRQPVEVVGEGAYQGTLERVAGGRDENGPRVRDHIALLMPEPTNPYIRTLFGSSSRTAEQLGISVGKPRSRTVRLSSTLPPWARSLPVVRH